jgi:hypothetical protein
MKITEFFDKHLGYDMWGWIRPNGTVAIPSRSQSQSADLYTHKTWIQEKGFAGYFSAFSAGWVRWYLKDHLLTLEAGYPYRGQNINQLLDTVRQGIKEIEHLVRDPQKFAHFTGPHAQQQRQDNAPLLILEYEIEILGDHYVYARSTSATGLLRKLQVELGNQVVNEYFDVGLNYGMFGWITPAGAVKPARVKHGESQNLILHQELADEMGIADDSGSEYAKPFGLGYIRWYIAQDRLCFNCWWYPNQTRKNIVKAAKKIEELCSDPKYFRHFALTRSLNKKHNQAHNDRILIHTYELETQEGYWTSNNLSYVLDRAQQAAENSPHQDSKYREK